MTEDTSVSSVRFGAPHDHSNAWDQMDWPAMEGVTLRLQVRIAKGSGRGTSYLAPPGQIRASGTTALGSCQQS